MTTNHEWCVPAGPNARRYAVFDVSNAHAHDAEPDEIRKAYFDALRAEVDAGGMLAMAADLLEMNIGDWHPRDAIPRTNALREQKMRSLRGPDVWWEGILQRGRLPGALKERNVLLIAAATEDAQKNFPHLRMSERLISQHLKGLGYVSTRDKTHGNARGRVIPPREQAKQHFAKRFGGSWDWDEGDDGDWA